MQRIVVLGPPGSGKSTLARQLGTRHGLPVFHLDQAFWRPGWAETPPECFRAEVERLAALPAWVIDGNYTATLAPRLARADLVVLIDMPAWRCMARLLRRTLSNYGRVRADAAPGCPERLDPAFLRHALFWNWERRGKLLARLAGTAGGTAILRTASDRDRLLARP